jgi:prepilin-type N-terminal cleavage/methylation domain-containing protein
MKNRSGFTLVETVFAIFIFSVGALGFAATTAVVIRSLGQSALRERAARIASGRLETLRSVACGGSQSGSETRQGVVAMWTVTPTATSSATAMTTVTYRMAGSIRSDTYSTVFPCK